MPVIGEVVHRLADEAHVSHGHLPIPAEQREPARPRIEVFYGLTATMAEAARPKRWPPIAYTNAVTQPLRELPPRMGHGLVEHAS